MSEPDPLAPYYADPVGLELVQAILDRKALHDHREGVTCHACSTYNRD